MQFMVFFDVFIQFLEYRKIFVFL